MFCREIDSDNTAPPAFPLRVLYGSQPSGIRHQASRQWLEAVSAAVNSIANLTAGDSRISSRNVHCHNSHHDCQRTYCHCDERSGLLDAGFLGVGGDVDVGHLFEVG